MAPNKRADWEDPTIEEQKYYHGLLPRQDMEDLLRNDGDFVIRASIPQPNKKPCYVLSVAVKKTEDMIEHLLIGSKNGHYCVDEDRQFESVSALVDFYLHNDVPINKSDSARIRNGVGRKPWELKHEDIELAQVLGSGAFGEVHKGYWKVSGQRVTVAIKIPKLEALNKEQIVEVMSEARTMRKFDHPNVVQNYGVAALREPLMIIMEVMEDGALDSYLQKHPETSICTKSEMCAEVAFGLDYLHSCNYIHCDVAARNCLYGKRKVKLSDFGLTVAGPEAKIPPTQRIPAKWTAPEVFKTHNRTMKSDVYAYGVTCWEILSNGDEPYKNLAAGVVHKEVNAGHMLQFRNGVPADIQTMVTERCWAKDLNERYEMRDVVTFWKETYKYVPPVKKGLRPNGTTVLPKEVRMLTKTARAKRQSENKSPVHSNQKKGGKSTKPKRQSTGDENDHRNSQQAPTKKTAKSSRPKRHTSGDEHDHKNSQQSYPKKTPRKSGALKPKQKSNADEPKNSTDSPEKKPSSRPHKANKSEESKRRPGSDSRRPAKDSKESNRRSKIKRSSRGHR